MKMLLRTLFLLPCLICPLRSQVAEAKPVIVSIGDSLTFGLGVPPDKTWPALLESKLKREGFPEIQVINAGSSGATTAFGISAIKFQLSRGKPDLIIYALGANDGLRGIKPETSYQNMSQAIGMIKKQGVKVLLLGMRAPPNYGEKFPKDFELSFSKVQKEYKLSFVPFFLDGVAGKQEFNQADGIHPNEKGYQKILETIYPKVRELIK